MTARLTPLDAGWLLPAVLSTTAGAVDVIGFLSLGAVFVGMLGVAAMATQNALVKLALPGAPSTAVMTTNTTQLTIDLATLAGGGGQSDDRANARRRASVMFPCVIGFLGGCAAGAIL